MKMVKYEKARDNMTLISTLKTVEQKNIGKRDFNQYEIKLPAQHNMILRTG